MRRLPTIARTHDGGPAVWLLGKVCASLPTKLLKSLHRLVKADARRVQVDAGRSGVRVPQELLHHVQRHTAFHPPRAGLAPQIVEVKIDAVELGAQFGSKPAPLSSIAAVAEATRQHFDQVNLTAKAILEAIRRQVQGDVRALFRPDGSLKPIAELTEEEASLISGFEVIKKNAEAGDGHMDTVHKVRLKDQSRYVEMAAKHFRLLDPEPAERINVEKLLILIQPKP